MESSDRNSSFLTAAISKRIRLTLSRQKDRISSLPDSILHHILSFLPTKDAAVTTFLSKRWKPLWLSQLLLHFDDKNFPHALAFRHFLYSFVSHRDTSLPILSFHLKCRHRLYRKQDFHNFVSSALNRRVQNLTIDLRHSFSSPITAKTLLVLKLRMLTFDKTPLVYLPSLKLLHLESVNFRNHEYLCRLLLGCPFLEELEVKDSIVNTLDRQCRRVAGLSNLIRANISDIHIDLNWLHNVEHLRLQVVCITSSITTDNISDTRDWHIDTDININGHIIFVTHAGWALNSRLHVSQFNSHGGYIRLYVGNANEEMDMADKTASKFSQAWHSNYSWCF